MIARLIVEFEYPASPSFTTAQYEKLLRECVDPLHRENVTVYAWGVAMRDSSDD